MQQRLGFKFMNHFEKRRRVRISTIFIKQENGGNGEWEGKKY